MYLYNIDDPNLEPTPRNLYVIRILYINYNIAHQDVRPPNFAFAHPERAIPLEYPEKMRTDS
jgi:hypothetical protein